MAAEGQPLRLQSRPNRLERLDGSLGGSYDVPGIVALPIVGGSADYLRGLQMRLGRPERRDSV
jgi:hypothetical protein